MTSEKQVVDKLLKHVRPADATFENTIIPYIAASDQQGLLLVAFGVYASVSNDTKLKEAVGAVRPNLTETSQKTTYNEDFCMLVDAVFQKQKDDETLTAESRKLLNDFHGDLSDAGLTLPAGEKRQRLRNNSQEPSKLQRDFANAITADQRALWFTKGGLNGTKPEILEKLEKGKGEHEGKLKVVVQSPKAGEAAVHCTNSTSTTSFHGWHVNKAHAKISAGRATISCSTSATELLPRTPSNINDIPLLVRTKLATSNVDTLKQVVVIRDEQVRLKGTRHRVVARTVVMCARHVLRKAPCFAVGSGLCANATWSSSIANAL